MKRRQFLKVVSSSVLALQVPISVQASNISLPTSRAKTRIGCWVFDGFETLDLHGPVEMLSYMYGYPILTENIEIFYIGEGDWAKSTQGPSVKCDKPIGPIYDLDIFIIPGGDVDEQAEKSGMISWITRQCEQSQYVLTVCTGSRMLARTGLINGRKATTNKMLFSKAVRQNNLVSWQTQARWVHDGKYITSSGVTAGTDAALYLISLMKGQEQAQFAATITEYEWNSDPLDDPFAVSLDLLDP
ncbi:ThiJ/PfpI family protein [Shewanella benthica]|uniref:ThiJ/PfpI family protein n=1 Tax=Shewanella benthica TaxID=43661 RepID=A0A330M6U9_9GAMM|nr:DJ-1/PfpI family protein [Shewanella benthica]SQH77858.1 ThiJ/PfpI family protein [Shewanella benthica]